MGKSIADRGEIRASTEGDDHPVVEVSWNDATVFCESLSKKGKRCYLPSEGQWEYACRAGARTAYPWGEDPDKGEGYANVADRSWKEMFPDDADYFKFSVGFDYASPAGSFKKNNFGLYDMIGNVLEWCGDNCDNYPAGSAVDPVGPSVGNANSSRVLHGGCWACGPQDCRTACRTAAAAGDRGGSHWIPRLPGPLASVLTQQ